MSFEAQERALFDLLFDSGLRARFVDDARGALAAYDLDDDEIDDFTQVRPDALLMDAQMRASMVLSQLCVAFPITFSIVSSREEGLELLRSLIDSETMRAAPMNRAPIFGRRLRDRLAAVSEGGVSAGAVTATGAARDGTPEDGRSPDDADIQTLTLAVADAELGMAWTASALSDQVVATGAAPAAANALHADWPDRPLRLAAFVSAAVIPLPYQELKKELCPVPDRELWRHLDAAPTSPVLVAVHLRRGQHRLLVARARVDQMSHCDPRVSHHTLEVSEGFAPMLQYVDGARSTQWLLGQLEQSGAGVEILASVKDGFRQLLESGMLETA